MQLTAGAPGGGEASLSWWGEWGMGRAGAAGCVGDGEGGCGVLVEVDVAELDDAIAVEGGGQIVDGDGAFDDVELVAGDLAGIESEPGGSDAGAYEEVSPGESLRLGRGDAEHMPF